MKFDNFFSIWSKFLSAFNTAKNDLDKPEQASGGLMGAQSSYISTLRRPITTGNGGIASGYHHHHNQHFSYEINTLAPIRTNTSRNLNTTAAISKPPSANRTANMVTSARNNFDRLCTDVRQCKYMASSTASSTTSSSSSSSSSSPPNGVKVINSWTPNRLKIRSINDFNLPHCRSSSES